MERNKWLIGLVAVLLMACTDKNDVASDEHIDWQVRKVAVVLPMNHEQKKHWEQTIEMAVNGVNEVQKQNILNTPHEKERQMVKMEFEWYDEEGVNMEELAAELAQRDDIEAVIGGKYSADAATLAASLCPAHKPFLTIATAEELTRAYASTGSLWAMVESDITQCEILLSRALYYGAKTVSLLANRETLYGRTFVEWFGFQAEELGLEVKGIHDFRPETLAEESQKAAEENADVVICVSKEIETIEGAFKRANSQSRRLYSDTAYGVDVLDRFGAKAEGIEGITFGAAPESGFDILYEIKYGQQPTLGAAQVYDAVIMLYWALIDQLASSDNQSLNSCMRKVADAHIAGACGPIAFDHNVYTSVLSTTYYHYLLYQGRYIILDYISSTGSHRTDATLGAWNWKAEQMQEFKNEDDSGVTYPDLDQKWALLVAGSHEWINYRHQADVLQMYQILRHQGYDDDHIVLIMEDDIANNASNPQKGIVQVRPNGDNLYQNVNIDYHTSQLEPSDIKHILCGEQSEKLPEVLHADKDDNVLIFWSGHGSPGQMLWLDRTEGFTTQLARETFEAMHQGEKYRKLLCLTEACYSGSVMSATEGIPGILAITAADPNETSKADIYNTDLHVWMSNRYTATLHDCIINSPEIPLRDLYYRLFINTVGSHVTLYNVNGYGNIYQESMKEFLK